MTNYQRTAAWLKSCGKEPGTDSASLQVGIVLEEFAELTSCLRVSQDGWQIVLERLTTDLNSLANALKQNKIVAHIPNHLRVDALDAICDSGVQPEALRLAAWLNEGAWHNITLGDVNAAGRELRKLHAETERLTAALKKANEQAEHFEREWYLRGDELEQLQAELVREAQRTANEKLRADQMTEQHRMQAAMNSEARAELAQLRSRPALSDEQIDALRAARNLAMRHMAAARIPECGEFGKIAQGLDAVLNTIGEPT